MSFLTICTHFMVFHLHLTVYIKQFQYLRRYSIPSKVQFKKKIFFQNFFFKIYYLYIKNVYTSVPSSYFIFSPLPPFPCPLPQKLFDASAPLCTTMYQGINNSMHSMGSTFNTFFAARLQTQTDEQQTVAAFVRRSQLFPLLACMPSGNRTRLQKSLAHT